MLNKVSEILKYGVIANMLHFNPATEYKRGDAKKAFKKHQEDRSQFSSQDLNMIFSQPWFLSGAGEFNDKGQTHWRPFYYWLPLLGIFTGGRLNEISQIYL